MSVGEAILLTSTTRVASVAYAEPCAEVAKHIRGEPSRSRALPEADRVAPVCARQRLGDRQPDASVENDYLESHSWEEYSAWHLGLTEGPADETKARYAFVYGDFQRVHRSGLIACVYRASEWRHKAVELAAHDLLQLLDKRSS